MVGVISKVKAKWEHTRIKRVQEPSKIVNFLAMDSAVGQLEESVEKADKRLDVLAWKLDQYEKQVVLVDGGELASEQVTVLKLLRSVNQVREEYENLRREISEVQQLQKQLSDSLRLQLRQVQGKFGTLRNKIINSSNQHN